MPFLGLRGWIGHIHHLQANVIWGSKAKFQLNFVAAGTADQEVEAGASGIGAGHWNRGGLCERPQGVDHLRPIMVHNELELLKHGVPDLGVHGPQRRICSVLGHVLELPEAPSGHHGDHLRIR